MTFEETRGGKVIIDKFGRHSESMSFGNETVTKGEGNGVRFEKKHRLKVFKTKMGEKGKKEYCADPTGKRVPPMQTGKKGFLTTEGKNFRMTHPAML